MKHIKKATILCCLFFSPMAFTGHTLNELNYCLALVKLVDKRLATADKNYPAEHLARIHEGLFAYKEYVELRILRPGLESYHRGDAQGVRLSELLFHKYQLSFMRHLNERYSEKRLLNAFTPAIEHCTQDFLPRNTSSYNKVVNALDTIKSMLKSSLS